MRILELIGGFGIGGAERAAQVLMQAANRSRFEFLAVGFSKGGPRMAALQECGMRCEIAGGDSGKLQALLEEFKPDVLHLHRGGESTGYSRSVLRLTAGLGVAVVETNIFGRVDGTAEDRQILRRGHTSLSSMLKYARATGASMCELYAAGHRAIYNAVPVAYWNKLNFPAGTLRRVREKWGAGQDDIVALRVGQPDLRKWSALLEMAIPLMLRANPNLRLAFRALPDVLEKTLERRFGSRLIAMPATSNDRELAQTYAAADLMAHSSHIGESFGSVLAEGMYWGLPVVVDSTPSMDNAQVEVVDNGSTGFVVDGPFAFADAVERLCRDAELRRQMGEAGRRKVREQFSDSVVARQWERAFVEAALENGNDVPAELVDYARELPAVPDADRHRQFEVEYERRLRDVFPAQRERDALERAVMSVRIRASSVRSQLRYCIQIGPRTVAGRAWHRLHASGNVFRRT